MSSQIIRFPSLVDHNLEERSEIQTNERRSSVRQTWESFSWTDRDLQMLKRKEYNMSDLDEVLRGLKGLKGFIAAAVANADSGMALATLGGGAFDIDVAAAANAQVIKSKLEAMDALGFSGKEKIEDILITLNSQYHLIRLFDKDPSIFLYIALDKSQSNLALARRGLAKAEQALDF